LTTRFSKTSTNSATNSPALSKMPIQADGETLTELTQRTLNRLVFLRFPRRQTLEPQNHIAYFGERAPLGRISSAESRRLDGIYKASVYKSTKSSTRPASSVDDDSFSGICERLSHLKFALRFQRHPHPILGTSTNAFSARSSSPPTTLRLEEKPKSAKPAAFITRPNTSSATRRKHRRQTDCRQTPAQMPDALCRHRLRPARFLLGV